MTTNDPQHRLGWIPDVPDIRDHKYVARSAGPELLPPSIDLRAGLPPVYDQGDLGSCTAQCIAAAIQYDQKRQNLYVWTPSRLLIYYNERVIENTVESDAGAQIRD